MKISRKTYNRLSANATRYAAEMIQTHGVEGAKRIAAEIEANRDLCPGCGMRTQEATCPKCDRDLLPF